MKCIARPKHLANQIVLQAKKLQDLATTLIRTPANRKGPILLQADELLNAALEVGGTLDYLNLNTHLDMNVDETDHVLMRRFAVLESLQARFAGPGAVTQVA